MDKKICPLAYAGFLAGPTETVDCKCLEEKCAWWTNRGQWWGCAIVKLVMNK